MKNEKSKQAHDATASAMKASDKAFGSNQEKDHKTAIMAHKNAIDSHDQAMAQNTVDGERKTASHHEQMASHHINVIRAHNSALDGTGHGGRAKESYDHAKEYMGKTVDEQEKASGK